ncbi:Low affinity immunoglobulin epsilon Fc receptor, partial [Aphelenchoides avenae]
LHNLILNYGNRLDSFRDASYNYDNAVNNIFDDGINSSTTPPSTEASTSATTETTPPPSTTTPATTPSKTESTTDEPETAHTTDESEADETTVASTTSTTPTSTTTEPTTTSTTKLGPCPEGWILCPGTCRCYKWLDGDVTQPQAQARCQEVGGNLATIDSAAATQCLLDIAASRSQSRAVWIGLIDQDKTGIHPADCPCWKWLDGTPYGYQNFAPGEPNNGRELCVDAFLAPSGRPAGTWNDESCESEFQNPALCSVRASECDTTTVLTASPTTTTSEETTTATTEAP